MGLLNSVMSALGGVQTGGNAAGGDAIQAVLALLAQGRGGDGLGGLVQRLQEGGLGEQVASWIGTGSNLPVSPAQLENVLGSGMLGQFADALGLSQGDAAQSLSQALPQMVDRLTPGGRLPPAGTGLGDIGSLLDRFSQR